MTQRLNILCKWRQAYVLMNQAGQFGQERVIRDSAEGKLIARCELSALANLLVQKGVFTATEFIAQVDIEAEALSKKLENVFPGFSANQNGLVLTNPAANQTMLAWQQPYGMGR